MWDTTINFKNILKCDNDINLCYISYEWRSFKTTKIITKEKGKNYIKEKFPKNGILKLKKKLSTAAALTITNETFIKNK